MPACLEGRFAREGFAQHIEMPLRSRPLSPMTYTTIPQWAPLIRCPRDCKGYRNRTVAKVRAMFKRQQHVVDSLKSTPDMKKESWSRGERIAAWTLGIAVAAILASFFIPEVRQFLHLEKPPQTAQVETKPPSEKTDRNTQSTPTVQSPE